MVVNLNPVLAAPTNERMNRNDAQARQAQWMLQLEREMFAKGMKKESGGENSAKEGNSSSSSSVAEFMRYHEEKQTIVPAANANAQSHVIQLQTLAMDTESENSKQASKEPKPTEVSCKAHAAASSLHSETRIGSDSMSNRVDQMNPSNDKMTESGAVSLASQLSLGTDSGGFPNGAITHAAESVGQGGEFLSPSGLAASMQVASGLAVSMQVATMTRSIQTPISMRADQLSISSLSAGEKLGLLSFLASANEGAESTSSQEVTEFSEKLSAEADFVLDEAAVVKLAYEGKQAGTDYEKTRLHLYHAEDGVHAWIRDAQLSHFQSRQLASNMLSEFAMQGTNLATLSINGKKVLGKVEELFAQPLNFDEELKTGNAHALQSKVALVKEDSHDN